MINRLNPTHVLPPEVLAHIFSLVPEGFYPYGGQDHIWGPFAIAPTRDLFPLTEVCHYWRDVALETPFLWSTLTADPLCYFHKRCPSSPLHVHILGNPPDTVLDMLRHEGERVKEIYVDYVLEEELVHAILDFDGKNVAHCHVEYGWDYLFKPLRLLRGHTAALRTLSLHKIPAVPDATGFPALRHLTLEFQLDNISPPLSRLLDFLDGCPHLESLLLNRFNECDQIATPSSFRLPRQNIALPNLRTLFLEDFYIGSTGACSIGHRPSVLTFWSALVPLLTLPRTCLVRVRPVLPHELNECADAIYSALPYAPTCMRIGPPEPRDSWCAPALQETYSLQLAGARDGVNEGGAVCFDILMPGEAFDAYPFAQGQTHLTSELAASPLSRAVRELHVPSNSAVLLASRPGSPPHGILDALPHLETLIVSTRRLECDIPLALGALKPEPAPDGPGAGVACPILGTLVVRLEDERQVAYLRELLEHRARAGSPVRRIVVGFGKVVDDAAYACAQELTGVEGVEEMKVVRYEEDEPMEFMWQEKAPRGCWDRKEGHRYWQVWP